MTKIDIYSGFLGAGKTTLLRTLCGELPPLSGVIEKGDTVRIGYFAQHCPALDPDTRIIDAVKDVAVHVYTPDGDLSASQMAGGILDTWAAAMKRMSPEESERRWLPRHIRSITQRMFWRRLRTG